MTSIWLTIKNLNISFPTDIFKIGNIKSDKSMNINLYIKQDFSYN